ncbi:MAG: hypothetical protein J6C19_02395 [Lachnospiraceae bacterium]|nr:hypothetical protein [Lachnospiraceae bacterium]
MKHKLQSILLLILVLLLSGCGISQSEYDALLEENKQLEKDNDLLSLQVKSLQEFQADQILESQDTHGKAWATTAFGDNTICFSDENHSYFHCISGKTYPISDDGISELWSDYLASMTLLGYMQREYPDKISYETISVKFFDQSGTYLLDMTFKRVNKSYAIDYVSCNILYFDTIISNLASLVND